MSKIVFNATIIPDADQDTFVAVIRSVNNEKELFSEFAKKLLFPDYFGNNWNALNDCLANLMWINEKKIVIVFESIAHLDSTTKEDLMDVLNDTVQLWNAYSDLHDVEIIVQ